jgi:hypothetical protein
MQLGSANKSTIQTIASNIVATVTLAVAVLPLTKYNRWGDLTLAVALFLATLTLKFSRSSTIVRVLAYFSLTLTIGLFLLRIILVINELRHV